MATSNSYISKTLLALVIIAGGLVTVYALDGFLDAHRRSMPPEWGDEDLSVHGGRLRGFAFGGEGLLADWYWMRSLQYVGGKLIAAKDEQINIEDLRPLDPRLLYPYLDTATDLDPKFMAAYTYGAVVLPAIDPEQAIALSNKGIANNPESWRLYQYLGYIYWKLERYDEAAQAYTDGARIAGAAPFMQLMAAAMKTQAGSRDTAREIYGQMARDDSDRQTQYYARFRLMWIDSLDEQDGIRAALKAFREKNDRCVSSWSELIPYLATIKLPGGKSFRLDAHDQVVDPSGAAYMIDKEKCDVHLNFLETKVPAR